MLLLDGQVHHDTHVIPMGNYVIGVGNYVIVTSSNVGNYVSADMDARMHQVRHQLLSAARHLTGAKVLAARLYGVGPVTALAMTCWLAGKDRFSSARKAVRFAGLDITVWSSDRKGPPGLLSRQGPPVLRWAVYEAGKTHARSWAPDHRYYAQVNDRQDGKRAALSEARKIIRQSCHILTELGDDALTTV